MEKIRASNVVKRYGTGSDSLLVLDSVDVDVDENEFVVILGPSGCGKTTLLKIFGGLVEPTDGEISIDGEPVDGPSADSAMVFQSFGLYPWRSVLDNVVLGLEVQKIDKASRYRRAREWIEAVQLDGFEDSYPGELSGGMQQRVGLARALAVDPDILLMDEPFGALDALTKYEMQGELLQLLDEKNKTIVFITHDVQEAILLADRVLVMSPKPATILTDLTIDFDRPRWKRRREIENSERFEQYEHHLYDKLGLTVDPAAERIDH